MTRHVAQTAALALVLACSTAGALEVNQASLAELEALGGVGTIMAARVVEAREQKPFADWADLRRRVKGVGPTAAARLSAQGLTVNGAPYAPAVPPRQ